MGDDKWTEIVPLDALAVRVWIGCFCIFPAALVAVGVGKLRQLREAHQATLTLQQGGARNNKGGGAGGGAGGPNRPSSHQHAESSATTGNAWPPTPSPGAAQQSDPPLPHPSAGAHKGNAAARRYVIEHSQQQQQQALPTAPHQRRYIADTSQQLTIDDALTAAAPHQKDAHYHVLTVSPAAAAAAGPPASAAPLPPWWTHKSVFVAVVSLLSGLCGCLWCLQCVVRGSAASMNTDLATLVIGAIYVAGLGAGRIKVQQQLLRLGVSMLAKGAGSRKSMAGLTPAQRNEYVTRFSRTLHVALYANASMFGIIILALIVLRTDPSTRRGVSIALSTCIFVMTIVGPGSSFLVTRRIIASLQEHAQAVQQQQQHQLAHKKLAGVASFATAAHTTAPTTMNGGSGGGATTNGRRDRLKLRQSSMGEPTDLLVMSHVTTDGATEAGAAGGFASSRAPSPTHSLVPRNDSTTGPEDPPSQLLPLTSSQRAMSPGPVTMLAAPAVGAANGRRHTSATVGGGREAAAPAAGVGAAGKAQQGGHAQDEQHSIVRLQMQRNHSAAVSRANSRRQSRRNTQKGGGGAAAAGNPRHNSIDFGALHFRSRTPPPQRQGPAVAAVASSVESVAGIIALPSPAHSADSPNGLSGESLPAGESADALLPGRASQSLSPSGRRRRATEELPAGWMATQVEAAAAAKQQQQPQQQTASAASNQQQQKQQQQQLQQPSCGNSNARRGSTRPPLIPLPPSRAGISVSRHVFVAASGSGGREPDSSSEGGLGSRIPSPSSLQLVQVHMAFPANSSNKGTPGEEDNGAVEDGAMPGAAASAEVQTHPSRAQSPSSRLAMEGVLLSSSPLPPSAVPAVSSALISSPSRRTFDSSTAVQQQQLNLPSPSQTVTLHVASVTSAFSNASAAHRSTLLGHGFPSPSSAVAPAHSSGSAAVAPASGVSSSSAAAAAAGTSTAARPDSLVQLQQWQDKLSALKKAMLPMVGTAVVAILILTVPWMSSHMTLSFPLTVLATNLALLVAAKQLPTDFHPAGSTHNQS